MIRRILPVGLTCLVLVLGSASALAEMHSFSLTREASLNGTMLPAGKYKIKIKDDQSAEVFLGKKLVLKTGILVAPLDGLTPGSVNVSSGGELVEVRLKKQVIRFGGRAVMSN